MVGAPEGRKQLELPARQPLLVERAVVSVPDEGPDPQDARHDLGGRGVEAGDPLAPLGAQPVDVVVVTVLSSLHVSKDTILCSFTSKLSMNERLDWCR